MTRARGLLATEDMLMSGVALIYVRRSMARYDEDRPSPERQLVSCVAMCEEKGWRGVWLHAACDDCALIA
ncbi:unnamed protein product [marine sediment metagenome]|uniref:Uncharacterized protein n=1 Tax=marine sediment metagenome TaxID=412755 RepID=X1EHI9_9ZZZZ